MPKKIFNEDLRKMPMSMSVPNYMLRLKHERGNNFMLDLLILGKWAYDNQINKLSLENTKVEYERRIAKLQEVIHDQNGDSVR